ncbi:hypothetical protein [Parasphingorhabdus halotolerans]|uniref:Uncharacterized protein n=1 Tax=Parasphingorhabdus halotolerans TaxID=2725558 RepID=A0A6H2DP11_9SPHN|nr:hypothetical protein [Parasphingorhabdus halotolerans]QJB70399.1 hypothetical protein HF685_14925 [Parasphingorhabdus halotolerans]
MIKPLNSAIERNETIHWMLLSALAVGTALLISLPSPAAQAATSTDMQSSHSNGAHVQAVASAVIRSGFATTGGRAQTDRSEGTLFAAQITKTSCDAESNYTNCSMYITEMQ